MSTQTITNQTGLNVWLGNLSEYNDGNLVGEWITIEGDGEAFEELTAKYGDDEWFIADYEPRCFPVEEHSTIEELLELVKLADEHGTDVLDWLSYGGSADDFEDAFCGHYDSMSDYAEELYYECVIDPSLEPHIEDLLQYIDWDAVAYNLECEGYWMSDNGAVFSPC